jgi:two-component system, NtrC family, response regulator HydG
MSRILVVEDDPDVLLVFEEVLVEAGHETDTAKTFCDAYALLDLREYDLVLSDGRLPDGTGITLADKAKTKGIPALIVTGYLPWLRDCNPKFDIRTYRVLQKPVRPSVLLAEVNNALGA